MSLWQPVSECDLACLPARGSTPAVPVPVRVVRMVGAGLLLVAGALLLPVLRLAAPTVRAAVTRALARGLLQAVGVRLEVRGRLPRRRALIVVNHISWLDIVALLAHAPVRLVPKWEVRRWPVIGMLATALGSIFVDRSRPRTLPATVAVVADALRAGDVVAGFPEGTTWCGHATGRFRPALFQAVLDAGAVVVPVTLRFRLTGGTGTAAAAFIADDTLLASLRRVVAVRGLSMVVTVSPILHPGPTATRRTLARVAESAARTDTATLVT